MEEIPHRFGSLYQFISDSLRQVLYITGLRLIFEASAVPLFFFDTTGDPFFGW